VDFSEDLEKGMEWFGELIDKRVITDSALSAHKIKSERTMDTV